MAAGFARPVRTAGVVLVVAACAALTACGATSAEPGAATAKPGTTASGGTPPTGADHATACPPAPVIRHASGPAVPAPVARAAADYLAVREAWLSSCQASTTAWEARARKLMTPRGWKLRPHDRVKVAQVRAAMTKHHWNVRVSVSCMANSEAGRARADWYPLFCAVDDTTLDASGTAVRTARLPAGWPFTGGQNPAPMAMAKRGGTWLVDEDLTGRAQ